MAEIFRRPILLTAQVGRPRESGENSAPTTIMAHVWSTIGQPVYFFRSPFRADLCGSMRAGTEGYLRNLMGCEGNYLKNQKELFSASRGS